MVGQEKMEKEAELSRIIINETSDQQIIVIKELNGQRSFPIVIGIVEIFAIDRRLKGIKLPRPMTHDLLVSVIEGLGATLNRLVIDKMVNNTFHAKLEFKFKNGKKKIVDARPSDGVALAVRTDASIFVDEDVIKKAAIFNA